jgi:hypothetical protein
MCLRTRRTCDEHRSPRIVRPFCSPRTEDPKRKSTHLGIHGFLKRPHSLRQDFGERRSVLGDAIPKNLEPQTHYRRESNHYRVQEQRARVPTEILESEAKCGV